VVHGGIDGPHSLEAGQRRGSRAMVGGGGSRKLMVGVRSEVREEVRRAVWGVVRSGTTRAPFYRGLEVGGGSQKPSMEPLPK
jgi:hypothetical protein